MHLLADHWMRTLIGWGDIMSMEKILHVQISIQFKSHLDLADIQITQHLRTFIISLAY